MAGIRNKSCEYLKKEIYGQKIESTKATTFKNSVAFWWNRKKGQGWNEPTKHEVRVAEIHKAFLL